MSGLKSILNRFNQTEGVIGSLVCSPDGILVDADISERFDSDTLSALVSSVGLTLANACKVLEFKNFSKYHITASKGDIIISNLGKTYFVVLTERGADISSINVQTYQAENEIKKFSSIG